MAETSAGFRLRRTVPYRRTVDGTRYTIGINDMRDDALVVVGVASPDEWHRAKLTVGDVLRIGSELWEVADITVGDRGTVDFVPASHSER